MGEVSPARAPIEGAAFYCVSDARYFLGAVALVNGLRVLGHTEPIHLLDCGLTERQREILQPEVTLVDGPGDVAPALLKTIAPLSHPAEVEVMLDTDLIVTRNLSQLIEAAAGGKVVAFQNETDRFVAEWSEVLDLGPLRRGPYLDFAALLLPRDFAAEMMPLIQELQDRVDVERGYWGRNDPDYPLLYADQDVMNAIVAARVGPERLEALDKRFAPVPPFAGLEVIDAETLRCAYEDGTEPYVVHHHMVKPWLQPTHSGVYSELMARLLVGKDLAVEVPAADVPTRFHPGPRAWAERKLIDLRERRRGTAA
jgi:hypothetical protein